MRIRIVAPLVALAVLLALSASSQATSPSTSPTKVVAFTSSMYGTVLEVDSGALKGYPLYEFSGDRDGRVGCGTTLAKGYDFVPIVSVPLRCTGPTKDIITGNPIDDWPALTTSGTPVAGHGVSQRLLDTLERPGIGKQVTYGGHPLYLYDDPSKPFKPQGEDYVETVHPLAPWHGYWFLVSAANGSPAPGTATLEAGTLPNGIKVLAVALDQNVASLAVTVYEVAGGAVDPSGCIGQCADSWIPLLTNGLPRVKGRVSQRNVGISHLSNGETQATYDGKPLFLYSFERAFLTKKITLKVSGTAGNGEAVRATTGASFTFIVL